MSRRHHIAIVGQPNVGKSTLFNRLTATRNALVANLPGLTRDRQYGVARIGDDFEVSLIDTGGLAGVDMDAPMQTLMAEQAQQALDESCLVLFMVDVRAGVNSGDHELAALLRRQSREVLLVGNKSDGVDTNTRTNELFALGFGEPVLVSASHGRGFVQLGEAIRARVQPAAPDAGRAITADARSDGDTTAAFTAGADTVATALAGARDDATLALPDDDADTTVDDDRGIVVAIIGRPNVGKSTLVNRLLGESRVIVADAPGTTRDSIYIPFERDGERYTLVDTAGVRRRGRVDETIEKFSIMKSFEAIRRANVVVLLLDARESLVEQDLRLLGHAIDAGRSVLIAINKWDGLSADARVAVRSELDRRLDMATWVEQIFISALHGSGVGELIERVRAVHLSARIRFSASELTAMLERLLATHPPPLVHGRRIKLRFAHPGGDSPPTVVIHGNQTAAVPPSYVRYLQHGFRAALGLQGSALRIQLKTAENPYAGRRNELNERQRQHRARMIAHDRSRDHKGRGKR